MQVARVVEHPGEQLAALVRAADPHRGERGADRGRHPGGGEHERARLDPQELDHVGRSGDHAAARGQRLGEGRHPQVDAVLDAEQLGGAGAAGAEHAEGVGLVDHQPGAVAAGRARRSRAAGRRRPPSRTRRRRRPARRRRRLAARRSCFSSRSRRLWRKARSLARERMQPSRIEAWSPESAITVSPGPRIVPSAPRLAWWPVVNTIAASVPDPVGELGLELEVQVDRAVQEARAGQPGAVAVDGVERRLLDPLVAGQAEVVVGAEHDPPGALHLDDRQRRALEHAEVGERGRARGRP